MKEKPILFSGPMVRAILDGSKTQTRRIIKGSPADVSPQVGKNDQPTGIWYVSEPIYPRVVKATNCPYGVVGDRLWVRETWQPIRRDTPEEGEARFQAAQTVKTLEDLYAWSEMPSGNGETHYMYAADFGDWAYDPESDLKPWKPSIHMPRVASRISLEVTGVRVERLQSISYQDTLAEGIADKWEPFCDCENFCNGGPGCADSVALTIAAYQELWEQINGIGAWDLNPWVWVVEFKRVKP